MVFGEEFHTGGKALKSDILAKKINFFKTLGDHIQDIGLRIIAQEELTSATTIQLYQVPANRIAYLVLLNLATSNTITTGTLVRRSNIELQVPGEDTNLISLHNGPTTSSVTTVTFPNPMKLFTGEILNLQKATNLTTTLTVGTSILYEIDKEISLQ